MSRTLWKERQNMIESEMPEGSRGVIGTATMLFVGALAAAYMITTSSMDADKQMKDRKESARQFDKTQKAASEAPALAAEKARQETLSRRRRRSQTLLTSPKGVLDTGETKGKTLLGG